MIKKSKLLSQFFLPFLSSPPPLPSPLPSPPPPPHSPLSQTFGNISSLLLSIFLQSHTLKTRNTSKKSPTIFFLNRHCFLIFLVFRVIVVFHQIFEFFEVGGNWGGGGKKRGNGGGRRKEGMGGGGGEKRGWGGRKEGVKREGEGEGKRVVVSDNSVFSNILYYVNFILDNLFF